MKPLEQLLFTGESITITVHGEWRVEYGQLIGERKTLAIIKQGSGGEAAARQWLEHRASIFCATESKSSIERTTHVRR